MVAMFRRRWTFKAVLSQWLVAIGAALVIYSIMYKLYGTPLYVLFIFFAVLLLLIILADKKARLTNNDVTRLLNICRPILEESAGLLLKPDTSLNFLEKFQREKIEMEIVKVKDPDPFRKRFITSVIILLLSSTISYALLTTSFVSQLHEKSIITKQRKSSALLPETMLPEVKQVKVTIVPPSYTGKGSRQQDKFNLIAEEGGNVIWNINTTTRATQVQLIFNDGAILSLSKDDEHINWRTQKQINRAGFYQVKIDDKISEIYKIEYIKDQMPVIVMDLPQPNTNIVYGGPKAITMRGRMSDDYGIKASYISATVSSGQGEGVKFKEQKLGVSTFRSGQREVNVQQPISWKALGMRPGDELYFYISAIDNRSQETRSQVYIVTLEDTANQTGMDGMVTPMDIQQELFRSQRQIIIETEQLLKNKLRISTQEFTNKSNNLGLDQKLLRMRYGKFLGEETDVEIGEAHGDEEAGHADDPQDIIDQYSHKHDNAEDASFFDSATKKQLKATLAEMWKAETKLRTILPKAALPFEYRALALLKDLQQKSRVYVAKTGSKTTPLKLDRRLTGDLSKVSQPVKQENIRKPESSVSELRAALSILEELRTNGSVDAARKSMLQKAFYELSLKAADMPSIYIPSLSALKKILNDTYRVGDIAAAQEGLQRMIAPAAKLPSPANISTMGLRKEYFNQLKLNRQ